MYDKFSKGDSIKTGMVPFSGDIEVNSTFPSSQDIELWANNEVKTYENLSRPVKNLFQNDKEITEMISSLIKSLNMGKGYDEVINENTILYGCEVIKTTVGADDYLTLLPGIFINDNKVYQIFPTCFTASRQLEFSANLNTSNGEEYVEITKGENGFNASVMVKGVLSTFSKTTSVELLNEVIGHLKAETKETLSDIENYQLEPSFKVIGTKHLVFKEGTVQLVSSKGSDLLFASYSNDDLDFASVARWKGLTTNNIRDNSIVNAKLKEMPTKTLKGNKSGSTSTPADLTKADIVSAFDLVTIDTVQDVSEVKTFTNGLKVSANKDLTFLGTNNWGIKNTGTELVIKGGSENLDVFKITNNGIITPKDLNLDASNSKIGIYKNGISGYHWNIERKAPDAGMTSASGDLVITNSGNKKVEIIGNNGELRASRFISTDTDNYLHLLNVNKFNGYTMTDIANTSSSGVNKNSLILWVDEGGNFIKKTTFSNLPTATTISQGGENVSGLMSFSHLERVETLEDNTVNITTLNSGSETIIKAGSPKEKIATVDTNGILLEKNINLKSKTGKINIYEKNANSYYWTISRENSYSPSESVPSGDLVISNDSGEIMRIVASAGEIRAKRFTSTDSENYVQSINVNKFNNYEISDVSRPSDSGFTNSSLLLWTDSNGNLIKKKKFDDLPTVSSVKYGGSNKPGLMTVAYLDKIKDLEDKTSIYLNSTNETIFSIGGSTGVLKLTKNGIIASKEINIDDINSKIGIYKNGSSGYHWEIKRVPSEGTTASGDLTITNSGGKEVKIAGSNGEIRASRFISTDTDNYMHLLNVNKLNNHTIVNTDATSSTDFGNSSLILWVGQNGTVIKKKKFDDLPTVSSAKYGGTNKPGLMTVAYLNKIKDLEDKTKNFTTSSRAVHKINNKTTATGEINIYGTDINVFGNPPAGPPAGETNSKVSERFISIKEEAERVAGHLPLLEATDIKDKIIIGTAVGNPVWGKITDSNINTVITKIGRKNADTTRPLVPGELPLAIWNNATPNGLIQNNDVIYNTDTKTLIASTVSSRSSIKHKENVKAYTTSAFDTLNQIEVVEFNFKTDTTKAKKIGFISEDSPELVAGANFDRMDMGNTLGLLIKAVQELKKENEELREMLNVR